MTKEELIQAIVDAFKDAPIPEHVAGDPEYWEALEAEKFLRGRSWREVSTEQARYYPLSLLGPAGWTYYMPAYLLASFDDFDVLDVTIHGLRINYDVSLATSDPVMQREIQESQNQRLAALDEKQRKAVYEFIRFVANDSKMSYQLYGDAQKVLAEWERWMLSR